MIVLKTRKDYIRMWILFMAMICSSASEIKAWSFSDIVLSGSRASDIYTESVLSAVERGMDECKYQFRWHTWGCPKNSFNVFTKTQKSELATKEMAFLHAMVSSSIVITLTRNCSSGHFQTCGCDDARKGGSGSDSWKWGGCTDSVKIGNRMAKQFLDDKETGRDIKNLINLHNNRVGRMIVKKTMVKTCKCHGVSGSCETQTCWMRVQDIRQVGNHLKQAYDQAKAFDTNRNVGFLARKERLKLPRNQLFYLEDSPNYCKPNATLGIPGTKGRECSVRSGGKVTRAERESCKSLCRACGYHLQKRSVEVTSTCKCKFQWCCTVKCKTCIEEVVKLTCV